MATFSKVGEHIDSDATIEVFVREIELEDKKNLYLVSNVEADAGSSVINVLVNNL